MADPVTAALMREAGQTRRSTDVAQAQDAVRALNDPNIGAEDSPAQVRERQAQIAKQSSIAGVTSPAAAPAPAPAHIAAPQQAANDPVTAALMSEARGGADLAIPGNEGGQAADRNVEKAPMGVWDATKKAYSTIQSAPETALSIGSGIAGGVVGAAAGLVRGLTGGKYGTPEGAKEAEARAAEVAHSLTYEPRSEGAKASLEAIGTTMEQTGLSKLAGMGPAEGMALAGAAAGPRAAQTFGRGAPAQAAAPAGQMGSVGAAGASLRTQAEALAAKAGPAMEKAAATVGDKWTPQKLKTLERYVDAETLPVPMKMMTGQASDNPTLMSQQFNRKGMSEKTANLLKEQNEKLIENKSAIREAAAPDVYVTSKDDVAEMAMQGYRAEDVARKAAISKNYQALKDANGGQFPMDAKAFVTNATSKLKEELKTEFVPPAIAKQMRKFAAGEPMTFEQFEAMKTNLAAEIRKAKRAGDGNAAFASGVVYKALDDLPMPAGAEHLKPLADAARASARERFALLESDPAYRAVVNGTAKTGNFINKFVVNADPKKIVTMMKNLENQPTAKQAIGAGAIDRLGEAAKIVNDTGVFNQAGYNKMLDSLKPKLNVILPGEQFSQLDQLGRVARYVKGQDAGTFFNNSNSWISALSEMAKSGAEGAANYAAGGIPIGRWVRQMGGPILANREFNKSMQTGAGLKLKDVGK